MTFKLLPNEDDMVFLGKRPSILHPKILYMFFHVITIDCNSC